MKKSLKVTKALRFVILRYCLTITAAESIMTHGLNVMIFIPLTLMTEALKMQLRQSPPRVKSGFVPLILSDFIKS